MRFIYKGKEYKSKNALYVELGITQATVDKRIQKGMTLEEAIEKPINHIKSVTYKGKAYRSKNALCVEFGISRPTVEKRMKEGMTLEEAIETPLVGHSTKSIELTINGKKFFSLKSAARYHNMSPDTLSIRLKNNEPLIKKPKRKSPTTVKKNIRLHNLQFKNIASIISYYNPPRAAKVRELLISEAVTVEVIFKEVLLLLKRADALNDNFTLKDTTGIKQIHKPAIINP